MHWITSTWISGCLMLSKILNTILKRSCHQACWNWLPYDFMISNMTVNPLWQTNQACQYLRTCGKQTKHASTYVHVIHGYYLVLTSSLHLVMTVESSNMTGNHALTQTVSWLLLSSSLSINIYNSFQTLALQGLCVHACTGTYLGLFRNVLGTWPDDANGLHACIRKGGVGWKFRQTLHSILEGVNGGWKMFLENVVYIKIIQLIMNFELEPLTSGLESKFNNGTVTICCSKVKNRKNVLPTRLDLTGFGCDHLSHTPHHHIPDSHTPASANQGQLQLRTQHSHLLISFHDVLKRSKEILLKSKISQFSFLQKLHGQLT